MQNSYKKATFSGIIWKLLERISAQGVSLVISIVLARLLLPDDYSVIGIVTIFFTLCEVFISGGLNSALIQKKDADDLDYSVVFIATFSVAILFYIIMFIAAPFIADIYNKPILVPIIRVMGLIFFIYAFKSVISAYISNKLLFKKFFFSTLGGTIISSVIGIVMAIKGFGPWALVAQQMSNGLIGTIILMLNSDLRIKLKFSFERFKGLFSYGWKIFLSSIITVIYDDIKPLVVGIKFSASDLAFYNKGRSFPQLINGSISNTISSVLFPVLSKIQDNKEMILSATRRFMQISSYIVFPIMFGLLAISDTFVVLLLTEKWTPIIPYIKIFCISYMFDIIQTGNLQTIRAIGRSDIIFKLEVIKKSIFLIVIALFLFMSNTPYMLAVSGIITTLIASICNSTPNVKLIGYKIKYQIFDILPNFISSFVMCICVIAIGKLKINSLLLITIQVLTGAVIYLLISIITKNKNFFYLLQFLNQSKKGEIK